MVRKNIQHVYLKLLKSFSPPLLHSSSAFTLASPARSCHRLVPSGTRSPWTARGPPGLCPRLSPSASAPPAPRRACLVSQPSSWSRTGSPAPPAAQRRSSLYLEERERQEGTTFQFELITFAWHCIKKQTSKKHLNTLAWLKLKWHTQIMLLGLELLQTQTRLGAAYGWQKPVTFYQPSILPSVNILCRRSCCSRLCVSSSSSSWALRENKIGEGSGQTGNHCEPYRFWMPDVHSLCSFRYTRLIPKVKNLILC